MADDRDSADTEARLREEMVTNQLESRGITDPPVLDAMRTVPRHLFVPENLRNQAYSDEALPIGPEQTISQPYVVALMLQALRLTRGEKVLEIGTGSGYVAALLSYLGASVFTVELDPELAAKAEERLKKLKFQNIKINCGDGFAGLRAEAPFDAIIVSAAPAEIPRELVKQLKEGGRMILPLGEDVQFLVLLEKTPQGLTSKELGSVRFVQMKDGSKVS